MNARSMPASAGAPSHVVGIGASAGGLDALERFFANVPKDTGMAFVVVQHLSPDFRSVMDELLARHTELPIQLVEDGMSVAANHVYLIPPKKEMIISGGRLLLSERDPQQELTLPIDVFFRSLAQDCGSRAIGIVLSGGGTDGSRGIRDIHEAGGLVLVQDMASAQFDGMPKTARDAGVADGVLAPQAMPAALMEHVSVGEARAQSARRGSDESGREAFSAVYAMLQQEFGIDFTNYKPSTITRRIERRIALARAPHLDEYVHRLSGERGELDLLYRDLLIGVTRFFRDAQAFEALEQRVLPELLERSSDAAPLRIWVPGCATGEEAYSLAIALQDLMHDIGERPVKIFATDVHRGSLERAGRALYDEEAVAGVSSERLQKYFVRGGGMYQVVPDLRQMIVFAQHDVTKDAPFTRIDLISCRNLLIYFQPAVQQKVLSLFHFSLNRGGVLLLGPSETAGALGRDFEVIDKHWRILRKFSDVRTPVDLRLQPVAPVDRSPLPLSTGLRPTVSQLLGTYDALLADYMPPSLLVTDRGELLHAFGGASRFLRPRDGRQGLDVLELVDTELKMVLVGGLKRALHEPSPVAFSGVRIRTGDGSGVFRVGVRRVRGGSDGAQQLLISFEAMDPPVRTEQLEGTEIDLGQVSREQLVALEGELTHTKENLQAAIEELEASNEELQASNEELHTSNEELQSTNEELQSVNEELYTVNAEYQKKISELTELTNDVDNLLASTEIGTVFLDGQLRIRKFTPQIAETFDLVPHDVGRPIETFAHRMAHPELVEDLKRVLASRQPVERELLDVRGKAFFLRVLPYRQKGTVDGVLLTLIDVSGLKAAEDALFHERYLLNSLLRGVPDAIYFKDVRGRFIRANHAMALRLGLTDPREAVHKTALELPDQNAALALHRNDEAVLRTGEAQHYQLERRQTEDGGEAWDLVTRLPLRDAAGKVVGVIVIFRDVTEQKHADEQIQEAVRRRDQFLAMLSHELRNPLGAIVSATALLRAGSAVLPQKRERLLEILERQSQQMARLLDDLLEASRVTQDKIELKKRLVDLSAVLKEAVDGVRAQFEARRQEFAVDIEPGPMPVDGDPARLQQIHVNLLSNAAKYTPSGGHIRLEAKREDGLVVVRVRDDGAGIPEDMLASVFDLFVQSSRTLDRSAGGLGVGLTLVRSLVAMHGGTVEAHSEGEGQGSEFVVRLPLCRTAEASEPRVHVKPRLRQGAKVVIVEDNADSRELLCEVLERAGFECHSTDNGAGALTLIAETRPDIAILDVGLPGMDGFELARRIRRDPRHAGTCLIALTGYGRAEDRTATRAAGFDFHLVKPVRTDELLALLGDVRIPGEEHTSSSVPPAPMN